jgi:hypothetical protein
LGHHKSHMALGPGDSHTVQIGELHTFANDREEWTLITVDTRPCAGVVRAFELAYGVANDGGAAKDGLPRNPLVRQIFIGTSEGFLPQVPYWFQRLLFFVASFIAKMTGLEKHLSKYWR